MNQVWNYLSIAFLIIYAIAFVKVYSRFTTKKQFNWSRFVSRVAIFSAISTLLYVVPIFQISLPIFPSFLSLHFDEIPALIAGYAYGPWVSLAVLLVKTVIKLPMTSTLCVGELADFLFSSALVLPATWIYKYKRNLKGVFIGFGVSLISNVLVACILNIYVIYPFYMNVMGMSYDTLLSLCQLANPNITSLTWPLALYVIIPMNLIKDGIVFVITFLVYRSIRKALHWEKTPAKSE